MKKPFIVLLLLLTLFLGFVFWWKQGVKAPSMDKTPIIFVVKLGEGVRSVANRLKEQDLIRDPIVFFLLTKKMGIDGQIQAGDFRLTSSMAAAELAEALTHGTLDVWITVPEGKRSDEIAQILQEKLPNYQSTWTKALENNEGYLFPDTYLIPHDAGIQTIISQMRTNFETKYASILPNAENTLTENEIVTLASLIEREARLAKDRPLIASVIMNRLGLGMALQIDATIQYALGFDPSQKTWWKNNLSVDDLAITSSFNSYKNTGLPPHPIANPGLSSLEAAVHPAKTDYLYYLSDKQGQNHYAKTLAEHNANIRKYGL